MEDELEETHMEDELEENHMQDELNENNDRTSHHRSVRHDPNYI